MTAESCKYRIWPKQSDNCQLKIKVKMQKYTTQNMQTNKKQQGAYLYDHFILKK